jgi:undecaprenyl diphosphate synthase
MDGNGRWAEARGQPRQNGHEAGAEAVRKVVTQARQRGVEVLTLYAFSTENWSRPLNEVTRLMELLVRFLKTERKTLLDNGIALRVLGNPSRLPRAAQKALDAICGVTEGGRQMTLNLALNYGSKAELLSAMQSVALAHKDFTEEAIDAALFTAGQPPVDLLIRTGGDQRLSNFLLWQAAYAELMFVDTLWPDFGAQALDDCLAEFAGRERRFGRTGAQLREEN